MITEISNDDNWIRRSLRDTGDLVAVDTFFVGHLEGVGKVYLQSAIDCCSRCGWGRFYTNEMPVTAVHLLNIDVLPTFEAHGIEVNTVLSDNGREFCGRMGRHPYELFLQLEGIEHRKTRVKRPQSNGIVEHFHRTLLDERFRVEGRRTWFDTVEEMQVALDAYLVTYNTERTHQGRGMNGRTPYRAFLDRIPANDNSQEDTDRKINQADAA
jgi:transposase InsO family protein